MDKEDLLIKVSIFTGDLEVEFYSDKSLTKTVFINGFHHLGDSQYRFSKRHREEDNITAGMYVRVRSSNLSSTYVIAVSMKVENIIRLAG